jgi:hypothetical protein
MGSGLGSFPRFVIQVADFQTFLDTWPGWHAPCNVQGTGGRITATPKETRVENLTYRQYCDDPAVRERIEEHVRELRREAVREFIVKPLGRAWKRLTSLRLAVDPRKSPESA